MSYRILSIPPFDRQLKRLLKKYKSLKSDLGLLFDTLESDPIQGEPLGNNCYKVRLAIASKGKGKSGGARVITNIILIEKTVYLIAIYDKSERESLSDKEILILLKSVPR